MARKPTLMILGTFHMANPGRDLVNLEADDVLTPRRQGEIRELVQRLRAFRASRVAVEVDRRHQQALDERYRAYRAGHRELDRSEVEQIGFRLARALGHPRVYAVDALQDTPIDPGETDFPTFAREHGQEDLLDAVLAEGARWKAREQAILEKGTILDLLRHLNQPEVQKKQHRVYFTIVRIGAGDRYPGASWVQAWYGRNLRIFANLIRLVTSPDDRILLIIGAGHVYLLERFARESAFFRVARPLRYLT